MKEKENTFAIARTTAHQAKLKSSIQREDLSQNGYGLSAWVGEGRPSNPIWSIRKHSRGRALRSKSLLGRAPQPQSARNHWSGVPRSHLALEIPARALATIYYRYAYATLMELLRFAMQKVYGIATIYYKSAYATPMELLRFAIEILIPPLLNCYDLL